VNRIAALKIRQTSSQALSGRLISRTAFAALLMLLIIWPSGNIRRVSAAPPPIVFNNAPSVSLPSGCSNYAPFATGDVDGDGKPDVVAICSDANGATIDVLPGNGDGTFGTPVVTEITTQTGGSIQLSSVALADITDVVGQGHHLDLIGADDTGHVDVFLYAGNDRFNSEPSTAIANPVYTGISVPVYTADLNGDGYLDIIVPDVSTQYVTYFLSNGANNPGTFGVGHPIQFGIGTTQEVVKLAIADFNGDGKPDLAVGTAFGSTNPLNSVTILMNTTASGATSASFTGQPTVFLTPPQGLPQEMAGLIAADAGNGHPDLIITEPNSQSPGSIYLAENDGNGNFTWSYESFPVPYNSALIVSDFNGDGKADLAIGNGNDGFTEYLNQGLSASGTLNLQASGNYVAGPYPSAMFSGDFNGDGLTDILVGTQNGLGIFLNKSGGFEGTQAFATGTAPAQLGALQNFFGSGEPDVAVAQSGANTFMVLGGPASGPNGTLPQSIQETVSDTGSTITALASGCATSVSPCATPFVAVATYTGTAYTSAAYVVTGGSNGPSFPITLASALGDGQVTAIAAGDLNGDGYTDLVFALGSTIEVFTGKGDGTFNATPQSFSLPNGASFATPIALAVVNFNGQNGLAALDQANSQLDILLNSGPAGALNLRPAVSYATDASPTGMAIGHFYSADTFPDIVVSSSNAITVFLDQGNGTFNNIGDFTDPNYSFGAPIVAADFNGDGISDLAVNSATDSALLLTGDGTGGFINPETFSVGNGPAALAVADFNGDGKSDIAIANENGGMVTLLLNGSATGTVPKATPTITWAAPGSITYGTPLSLGTQLDATATVDGNPLDGTYVYSPPAGTVLTAGTQTLSVTFTPTDTADYGPATASMQIIVSQAVPTVTWSTPASINAGTALSSTQLDATSSIAGTFTYDPPAGTVLSVGTQTLSVTFTPSDTADYESITTTVTLTINSVSPPPPVYVTDNEAITVSDAATFPDVTDSEPITVSDSVAVNALTLASPIGVAAPVADFSVGSPLGFNSQSQNQQTVAISNIGQAPASLTLPSVAISPVDSPFAISSLNCFNGAASTGATAATLSSGSFCTVTITYTGSSPTTDTGTLVFTDNAALSDLTSTPSGSNYTQAITLTGSGTSTTPPGPPPTTVSVTDNEAITVTDTVNATAVTPVVKIGTPATNPYTITAASGYSVTVTLVNGGNIPIDTLTLTKATLGSLGALTFPTGTTFSNVAPGASVTLSATFSSSAGAAGKGVPLSLTGTYAAGALSGNWTVSFRSVTLP